MAVYNYGSPGLNSVGSYQKSGQPYASGGIDATSTTQITFPYVTKYFQVINWGATNCKVGFSALGVAGSNYFGVVSSGSSQVHELAVSSIFISGSANVQVIAGLTGIETNSIVPTNWTGSTGVG